MLIPRRAALLGAAALVPAAALAGCGLLAPTSPANVATDIATLSGDVATFTSGLQGVLPGLSAALAAFKGGAGAVAAITGDLAKINGYAGELAGFSNLADATSASQGIVTAIRDILSTAAQFPIPEPYAGVITAASVLLPIIEAEAGLPTPAAAALAPKMSPAAARALLKAAAQGAFKP